MIYNPINPGILLLLLAAILSRITARYRSYSALGFISAAYALFWTKFSGWNFFWSEQFLFSDERVLAILVSLMLLSLLGTTLVQISNPLQTNQSHNAPTPASTKQCPLPWLFVYVGSTICVLYTSNLLLILGFIEIASISATFAIFCSGNDSSRAAGFSYLKFHLLGGALFLAGALEYYSQAQSFQIAAMEQISDTNQASILMLLGLLINMGIPPISGWLLRAYTAVKPGTAITLSACTTKVMLLITMSAFPGCGWLISVGLIAAAIMALRALVESSLKRLICYLIVVKASIALVMIGVGERLMHTAFVFIINDLICIPLLMCSASFIEEFFSNQTTTQLSFDERASKLRWLTLTAALPLLSLSAFPLTLDFVSEFYFSQTTFAENHWLDRALHLLSIGTILICCFKIPARAAADCGISSLSEFWSILTKSTKIFYQEPSTSNSNNATNARSPSFTVHILALLSFNSALIILNVYFIKLLMAKAVLSQGAWKSLYPLVSLGLFVLAAMLWFVTKKVFGSINTELINTSVLTLRGACLELGQRLTKLAELLLRKFRSALRPHTNQLTNLLTATSKSNLARINTQSLPMPIETVGRFIAVAVLLIAALLSSHI